MKLVDILARELREWPRNQDRIIQSVVDAEIIADDEEGTLLSPRFIASRRHDECEIYPSVTEEQWLAARAAIAKAERGVNV